MARGREERAALETGEGAGEARGNRCAILSRDGRGRRPAAYLTDGKALVLEKLLEDIQVLGATLAVLDDFGKEEGERREGDLGGG